MPNCRNCHSKETRMLFKKESFVIYRCMDCRLIFSDKFYSPSQGDDFYSEEYYKNLKNFSPITDSRYASILSYLAKYIKGRRILDIGCGSGQFLLAARGAGWEALGVEISPNISCWARDNFGLDIRCGEFLEIDFAESHFDTATMFESIEHLNYPNAYLSKINSILKDGGMLLVTTPNFSSLSRRLLGKSWSVFSREHLFYFSIFTLSRLLNQNGFKIVKSITKNFSVFEFRNLLLRPENREQSLADAEKLRAQIEDSSLLKLLKKSINGFLDLTRLGDSIWIFAQKAQAIK